MLHIAVFESSVGALWPSFPALGAPGVPMGPPGALGGHRNAYSPERLKRHVEYRASIGSTLMAHWLAIGAPLGGIEGTRLPIGDPLGAHHHQPPPLPPPILQTFQTLPSLPGLPGLFPGDLIRTYQFRGLVFPELIWYLFWREGYK